MTDEDQITLSTHAVYSPHSDGAFEDRRHAAIEWLKDEYAARHFRVTRVDGGMYVESWPQAPRAQGEFTEAHARKVTVLTDVRELV